MKLAASVIATALAFALGAAWNEWRRPQPWHAEHVHEWRPGFYGGDPVWCDCGLYRSEPDDGVQPVDPYLPWPYAPDQTNTWSPRCTCGQTYGGPCLIHATTWS